MKNVLNCQFFDMKKLPTEHHHGHQIHDMSSIVLKDIIFNNQQTFEQNVGKLLWENVGGDILRIKGLIVFESEQNLYELQGYAIDDVGLEQHMS